MAGEKRFPLAIVVGARVGRSLAVLKSVRDRVASLSRPAQRVRGLLRMTGVPAALSAVGRGVSWLGSALFSAFRWAGGLAKKLALVGVAGGVGVLALVKRVTDAADGLAKMSFRLGIGSQRLQAWRFAAESAGVSAATFDMAMQRAGRRVGEAAAGTGEARTAIAALGLELTDAEGRVRSMEDLLPELADKLAAVEDVGVRNALAMKFFDSEGVAVVQMLKDGARGLEEFERAAAAKGAIFTDAELKASERFSQTWLNLKTIVAGVARRITFAVLPTIQSLADRTQAWLEGAQPKLDRYAAMLRDALPVAVRFLRSAFDRLWERVKAMAQAWHAFSARMSGFRPIALKVFEVLKQGANLFHKVWLAAWGGVSDAIGWVIEKLVALRERYSNIWDFIKLIAGSIGDLVWEGMKAVARAFEWLGEKLEWLWNHSIGPIVDRIGAVFDWVNDQVGDALALAGFSSAGPVGGSASAAAAVPPPGLGGDARVRVVFENVPAGVDVGLDPSSTADTTLDVGPALPEGT